METKNFFSMDSDDAIYYIVARDMNHAKHIIKDSGVEFGDPGMSYEEADKAGLLYFKQLPVEHAQNIQCDDDGTKQSLANLELGDWLCSEF